MAEPKSTNNILLTVSYIGLFSIWALSGVYALPVAVNLNLTSTLILYIGSHRSLRLLVSEQDGGASSKERETISKKDAMLFPFIGSAALFGLYVAFKFFDKATVNLLLSLYFSLVGTFTLTSTTAPFVSQFIPSKKQFGFKKDVPYLGEIDAQFTPAEIVCLIFSAIFSGVYFHTKHYLLNNILGISFCIQSIERISIGSYKIGAILLIGLFFYGEYAILYFSPSFPIQCIFSLDPSPLFFPA
jgi:minor histocompatibility antigen H13